MSPKILGLGVRIFRNFWDCFRTVRDEFSGLFLTVQTEFLRLFLDSPDRIFGIVFKQSWIVLRFGFDSRLMSSGFMVCFDITVIR